LLRLQDSCVSLLLPLLPLLLLPLLLLLLLPLLLLLLLPLLLLLLPLLLALPQLSRVRPLSCRCCNQGETAAAVLNVWH
jgi:hypothetical protein